MTDTTTRQPIPVERLIESVIDDGYNDHLHGHETAMLHDGVLTLAFDRDSDDPAGPPEEDYASAAYRFRLLGAGDPEDTGEVSDGYHTFNELYAHRRALTAALCSAVPDRAWRSRVHSDGIVWDGWFIVGLDLPGTGQVSYHYRLEDWDDFAAVPELDRAPAYDGHTSDDVIVRLLAWATP